MSQVQAQTQAEHEAFYAELAESAEHSGQAPQRPTFDLRGAGMASRRKDKAATPRQLIFVAHLAVRALRLWDDVKATVAAMQTQEDVHECVQLLKEEIASLPDTDKVRIFNSNVASIKQWQFIGDLIADRELPPREAEALWVQAICKIGAQAVIAQLTGKKTAARVAG